MVKGFIINKFRGDKRLLLPGLRFLERYTKVRTLGVVPYFRDIRVPEEDSLPAVAEKIGGAGKRKIRIDVICLPHMSNFTDFDPLEREPDVSLKYVSKADEIDGPDVIIIPGTKNTIDDLLWLRRSGVADRILSAGARGIAPVVIGICGGYQILGEKISDMGRVESRGRTVEGLKLLPVSTDFCEEKALSQVRARHRVSAAEVMGYEIHHGRTTVRGRLKPVFSVTCREGGGAARSEGVISADGRCWGTYIHGLFDSDRFRRYFLNDVRRSKGWEPLSGGARYDVDGEFDKLARLVRDNIDMDRIYKIMGL